MYVIKVVYYYTFVQNGYQITVINDSNGSLGQIKIINNTLLVLSFVKYINYNTPTRAISEL